MDGLVLYFGIGVTAFAGIVVVALTALRAFTGWLDLKRAELATGAAGRSPATAARIDIADLKERIRKLEAIAAGVDI